MHHVVLIFTLQGCKLIGILLNIKSEAALN